MHNVCVILDKLTDLLSAYADRQGVDISFTVCLFVCLSVRLRVSPPRIKLRLHILHGGSSASKAGNLLFL